MEIIQNHIECNVIIIAKSLKDFKPIDCVGKLFINKNNVASQLFDLEDILKSNGYFGSMPYDIYITHKELIQKENYYITESFLLAQFTSNEPFIGEKVIATTDSSLIYHFLKKEGKYKEIPQGLRLPQIPPSFISYYITKHNGGEPVIKVLVEINKYDRKLLLNDFNEVSILTGQKEFFSREELKTLFESYGDNLAAKITWNDIKKLK